MVIFYRSKNKKITKTIKAISQCLKKKNIDFILSSQKEEQKLPKTDLIICLGGDGTYLKAVKFGKGTPILGINMGSLGFLTSYTDQKSLPLLEKTLKGQMFLKKNYFLKACLFNRRALPSSQLKKKISDKFHQLQGKKQKIFYGVNDIVIERGALSHLINLSIFINKEFIYSLKSDGLIISSPIGSTAYNLAAGGPILHPKVSAFVITPICSHSLTSRPIVIPEHSEIYLHLEKTKAYLTIDGSIQSELSSQSVVLIKKDQKAFFSVTEKEDINFMLLRKKLKFGQRN